MAGRSVVLAVATVLVAPLLALTVGTTAAVPATAATPTYGITGWGVLTPGGSSSASTVGNSVNAGGDGTGNAMVGAPASNITHAVLFKNGTLTDLGTLNPGDTSTAFGVNDHEIVVGADNTIGTNGSSGPSIPTEWSNGKVIALGGGVSGDALSINNLGTVVGFLMDQGRFSEAVQFNADGSVTDLGNLPDFPVENGNVAAADINDAGQAVGESTDSSDQLVPVTFAGGAASRLPVLAGSTGGAAVAISERNGYIVGGSNGASAVEATQYGPGPTAVDLGHLPGDTGSEAESVNSSGLAVGISQLVTTTNQTAVSVKGTAVMFSGGHVIDLNTLIPSNLGWNLQGATGINDAGVIVGYGLLNGVEQGFTMSPLFPKPSPFGLVSGLVNLLLGPQIAAVVVQLGNAINIKL